MLWAAATRLIALTTEPRGVRLPILKLVKFIRVQECRPLSTTTSSCTHPLKLFSLTISSVSCAPHHLHLLCSLLPTVSRTALEYCNTWIIPRCGFGDHGFLPECRPQNQSKTNPDDQGHGWQPWRWQNASSFCQSWPDLHWSWPKLILISVRTYQNLYRPATLETCRLHDPWAK